MTELTTTNNSTQELKCSLKEDEAHGVKEEDEITVKLEFVECLVCLARSSSYCDLITTTTSAGTSLNEYLSKFTYVAITKSPTGSKFVCKTCLNLVNILEHAELEYTKIKEEFQAVISKNPLFESTIPHSQQLSLDVVKNEDIAVYGNNNCENDSEDEPLALTKKKRHRKVEKRKRKPLTETKRKLRSKAITESAWECTECEASGECGGEAALTAHTLVAHFHVETVKKEESPERSQSPNLNGLDDVLKMEADTFDDDDDDSSIYVPDDLSNGTRSKSPNLQNVRSSKKRKTTNVKKKKDPKVMHQCDQCNARYTSQVRLEQHKLKHDDSKPPYICEVCGAHYKHKRACDIHVALHKGISDWKCEECNKLFPSKGALQRHNNIHTGKLNYQCDLCGKSFIHTSSFKMHKLSHSGVKPHACDVCGLALMTRSHLKRHKRVHSGEKRHECSVCGKRFSERYNLVAHSRAHAGDAHAALAGARRRLFRCAFCPERFERRYMLERHAAAAHGRALERPPPTPRNTMSKLLKAQAQRRDAAPPATVAPADDDSKVNRSPESRAASGSKQQALGGEANTWAGAYAEFGLRHDYSH